MTRPARALFVLFATTLACATTAPERTESERPAEASPQLALMQERIDGLERRVTALESAPATQAASDGTVMSWSCMAKCGIQSTQTTEERIEYERVTGRGRTAADAYEDMTKKCTKGRLYDRREDHRFIGGDMRSSCMRDDAIPEAPK